MKSKIIFIVLLIQLNYSCDTTCDETELIATYRLTEFEISLIPYTQYADLRYLDQDGIALLGSTQPRIIGTSDVFQEEGSCSYTKNQAIFSFLTFKSRDIAIKFQLGKGENINFSATHFYPDSQESLNLVGVDFDFDSTINEAFTDVSILGFDFEDVLIFEGFNEESKTKLIIYSIKNGVELVEYRNGNYLRLIQ